MEKLLDKMEKKHPVHIVNNLHDYDDDWNYPQPMIHMRLILKMK